jgi:two-component system response regulator YesN
MALFEESSRYSPLLVRIVWSSGTSLSSRQDLRGKISDILNERDELKSAIFGFLNDDIMVLFCSFLPDDAYLEALYRELETVLSKGMNRLSLAQGSLFENYRQLYGEIDQLEKISRLYLYDGKPFHMIPDSFIGEMPYDDGFIRSLSRELASLDRKKAGEALQTLHDKISMARVADVDSLNALYSEIYGDFQNWIQESNPGAYLVFHDKGPDTLKKLEDFPLYGEFHNYFTEMILTLMEELKNADPKGARAARIMQYINLNFHNANLSVEMLSEEFELSSNYLCSIFKKAAGKTIHQYLTDVRIEKAKELLQNSNFKIYEIAEMVGYLDTNYFSTVFKKILGHPPLYFRK